MYDPVCELKLSLYGHPQSGGYWEDHCESHLFKIGFRKLEGFSTYWHEEHRALLIVYVDDFKMAGLEK
jgi:hypothetical protein